MVNRSEDVESIIRDLRSDDLAHRRRAIFAAARLGERAVNAIPGLQQIARPDSSVELRYLARKALGALADLVKGPSSSMRVRKSARVTQALALGTSGAIAVKLSSTDPHIRASAYRAAALNRDTALL